MNVIEAYIESCAADAQKQLYELYHLLQELAPQASEKISWAMPTFYLNGNLVHFACHKTHIGFYPGESGVANFEDRLASLKHSKGAIQFPLHKPLPTDLIRDIVALRIREQEKINAK